MPRTPPLHLRSLPERKPGFIEPMECLSVSKLPEGPECIYEIKLDGYRAMAVKASGRVALFSRHRKSFNRQYPYLVEALAGLPDDTVVDGEVVALDGHGRPNFNLLQQFRAKASHIHYFIFDFLILEGRDLTILPLEKCREIMNATLVLHSPRIRISEQK